MRIGAPDARPILILPPLFEELNRTRAFLASVMRRLAESGFGCWLPDLPGTGESELELRSASWVDWRHAVQGAANHASRQGGRTVCTVAARGGCLFDDAVTAAASWRLAPVAGASLSRDLTRAGLVSGTPYGGYSPDPELVATLESAAPRPVPALRTVRLASDTAEADAKLEGPTLWRRSEPGNAPELSDAIASDIYEWFQQCAVS